MSDGAALGDLPVPAREPDPASGAIVASGLSMTYIGGDGEPLHVLDKVDLTVAPGEAVAVIGESGSGKSTLLHLLGGLDRPTAGQVTIGGVGLQKLSDDELSGLRNAKIGFVFQFHHLLREFSALENVMIPQLIAGADPASAGARARELLSEVGLGGRMTHKPAQLSGGEQQRVAVARALANRPVVLLADEPTGNLDPATSAHVHDVLFEVAALNRAAMVLVTHDMSLASRANRVLALERGRLVLAAPRPSERALVDGLPNP